MKHPYNMLEIPYKHKLLIIKKSIQSTLETPLNIILKPNAFWEPSWHPHNAPHVIPIKQPLNIDRNTLAAPLQHPFFVIERGSEKRFQITGCFKKKVLTLVSLISWLLKHLKKSFCTFFNSQAFAESKNKNISILGLKLEKLLTKI